MKKLNRGVTFLETIISLGLISIFSLILFPILKTSNILNGELVQKGLTERQSTRILNIIENSIRNSSPIFKNYSGRKYIKNGVGILKEEKLLNYMVKEENLAKISDRGNVLFLEYPRCNGARVEDNILLFQFFNNNLLVAQGEIVDEKIKIIFSDTLYQGVEGYFEKKGTGIAIEIVIFKENKDIEEKVKGYENFNIYF